MDSSQPLPTSSSTSPRSCRELQGPRPAPLRVRKDSHKVRKPPIAPQPHQHFQHQFIKAPLIIYSISPKVIHTNPNDFMTLVQRLTGADHLPPRPPAPSTSSDVFDNNNDLILSPAARYAVMDKFSSYNQQFLTGDHRQPLGGSSSSSVVNDLERSSPSSSKHQFIPAGILSPGPASLNNPNAHSSFFSPLSSDPNSMSSFFQGLSPVMNQGITNKNINFMELAGVAAAGSSYQHIPSPAAGISTNNYSNLFLSPSIISPTIRLWVEGRQQESKLG
ncbi:hypothetical protein QQ045_020488 [Rhodiola kirilowii]